MDDRVSDRTEGLVKQPLFPCQRLGADLWFNDRPAENPEQVAFVEQQCLNCPLAQQVRCARMAVTEGHLHGTWAAVTLPGESWRKGKRELLAEARERLRLIAGIEHCPRKGCGRWYRAVEHTPESLAEARESALTLPYEGALCPRCVADDKERKEAEERAKTAPAKPQLPGGDPTDESDLALYWSMRRRHRRNPTQRVSQSEWLLITETGEIEGCYAWSIAARSFGRTDKRFLALLAEGWTVRYVTAEDRDWNRRVAAPAADPVSVTTLPATPRKSAANTAEPRAFADPIPA